MTVFKVTYRIKMSDKPWDVKDSDKGLYLTKELAEDFVNRLIGPNPVKQDIWFMDVWTNPKRPKVECIVTEEVIHDGII